MQFYSYFRSSTAWRVRIVLNVKGLHPEYKFVHLVKGEQKSQDYHLVNPNAAVPSLVLENGVPLIQSMAICQYLEEAHPEPRLLPADLPTRAQIRGFCEVINSGMHPYQNLKTLQALEAGGMDKMKWAEEWNRKGMAVLEDLLKKHSGKYSFGDSLSLADAFLYPQAMSASTRFGVSLDDFPCVKRVVKTLSELPPFIEASPQKQKDFEG